MRVLVLGGTGFIGGPTVLALRDRGHEVAVLHRGKRTQSLPDGVQSILGGRENLEALAPELRRFRPDVAIDVIPLREADATPFMTHLRGLAQRVLALSSADVYRNYDGLRRVGDAPPDPVPLAETAPVREHLFPYRSEASGPGDLKYDYEKLLVERAFLGDPDLPGTVLRLPMVYGPGDRQHRLHPYLRRMDDGRPAIFLGAGQAAWRWTRGYVENVAAAVAAAATSDRAAGEIYNVGSRAALTEAEWVSRIAEAVGWTGDILTVPDERLPEGLRLDYDWRYELVMDTRKIRALPGFDEPVPDEEALRRTIDWERRNRPPETPPGAFDYDAEDALLAHPAAST